MLFEDRNGYMAPQKEINITFRCDEEFRDWLCRKAGRLDMDRSALIRAAVLLAVPQIEHIRGIARIQLEDIKMLDESPQGMCNT